MDSDSWISSRLSNSSRRYYSRSDLFLGGNDDSEPGGDDLRAEYLCPFCAEDYDVVSLCCHIDEEHPLQANTGFIFSEPTFRTSHFLEPLSNSIEEPAFNLNPSSSSCSVFEPKEGSLKIHFKGWRYPHTKWVRWVDQLKPKYESVWKKAGIFEAIMSTKGAFDIAFFSHKSYFELNVKNKNFKNKLKSFGNFCLSFSLEVTFEKNCLAEYSYKKL